MDLVNEKQGGLVPTGLKRWPIKLIEHFADATGVSPSPAGPAGCCPLNFLNLINLKFHVSVKKKHAIVVSDDTKSIKYGQKLDSSKKCLLH